MLNIHFDFVQRDDSAATRAFALLIPSRQGPEVEIPTRSHPGSPFHLPERITQFVTAGYERRFFDVAKWSALTGLSSQLRAESSDDRTAGRTLSL